MGGHGNTLVRNVGNIEFIRSGDATATVILNDQGEAIPTLYDLINVDRVIILFSEEVIEESS
jgi:hypothetical protein